MHMLPDLLHGEEKKVWGDAGSLRYRSKPSVHPSHRMRFTVSLSAPDLTTKRATHLSPP